MYILFNHNKDIIIYTSGNLLFYLLMCLFIFLIKKKNALIHWSGRPAVSSDYTSQDPLQDTEEELPSSLSPEF